MRFLNLLLLPLFIAACNGVNSSMTTGPVVPPDEKPTNCKMDFTQTCWSRTVEKITSCLNKKAEGTDVFNDSREFCSNSTNDKLIHFQSMADIYSRPMDFFRNQLSFKVYPDSVNECFSVAGSGNNFTIRLAKTGETVQFKFDKSEMAFNCLDGQQVSISADKINGCQNVLGGEFASQVPGLVFEKIIEQGQERGWVFRFRGAPETPDVFRCYYP